jgi:hypothetical protein
MPCLTRMLTCSIPLSCALVLSSCASRAEASCNSLDCNPSRSIHSLSRQPQDTTRPRSPRRIPVRKEQPAPGHSHPSVLDFPWPPPKATARYLLPRNLLQSGDSVSLGRVASLVRDALGRAGVEEYAVYTIKSDSGLAFVTRLERIDKNGRPLPLPDRWPEELNADIRSHSFGNYLRSLFVSEPGYYRMVAIVLTTGPVLYSDKRLTSEEAEILIGGSQHIAPELMSRYIRGLEATALIYQFRSDRRGAKPRLLARTSIPPVEQLAQAGYWKKNELQGR